MSIEVQAGVPIPASRTSYPFASMEVNDSFFVAGNKADKPAIKIAAAARAYGRKHEGVKFAVRTVAEEGVEGVRCWRTA